MTFGMKDTCKLVFLFCLILAACGTSRAVEYIVDLPAQTLKGPTKKDDLPLSFCEKNICYAFPDHEVRAIKKYISELELRLKECQSK